MVATSRAEPLKKQPPDAAMDLTAVAAALTKTPPLACTFRSSALFTILVQLRIARAVPNNTGLTAEVVAAFIREVQSHLPQAAIAATRQAGAWAADQCAPAWPPSLS